MHDLKKKIYCLTRKPKIFPPYFSFPFIFWAVATPLSRNISLWSFLWCCNTCRQRRYNLPTEFAISALCETYTGGGRVGGWWEKVHLLWSWITHTARLRAASSKFSTLQIPNIDRTQSSFVHTYCSIFESELKAR